MGGHKRCPVAVGHLEVEETLHNVEALHVGHPLPHKLANLSRHGLGRAPRRLDVGENHKCEVAGKLAARLLQHDAAGGLLYAVERLQCVANGL